MSEELSAMSNELSAGSDQQGKTLAKPVAPGIQERVEALRKASALFLDASSCLRNAAHELEAGRRYAAAASQAEAMQNALDAVETLGPRPAVEIVVEVPGE